MKLLYLLPVLFISQMLTAQSAAIRGQLQDAGGMELVYANIALYNSTDSSLYKVETSDAAGHFYFRNIEPDTYRLIATYIGVADYEMPDIRLESGQQLELGILTLAPAAVELAEATVRADRAMVEVKPDRTVFNVQGTINSSGSDAISLLRMAPGVTVDNNDNIGVLGRSGVLVYVDGKRLPLSGRELSNYLQNLQADQIDRIDIITNPGAKYEAQGNAGIIDIRLKKDKSLGANGSVNGTYSQGQLDRYNAGASGNFRNRFVNVFATAGHARGSSFNKIDFLSFQNGLVLNEKNRMRNQYEYYNLRLGTDFYISKNNILGFLVSGNMGDRSYVGKNHIALAPQSTPGQIDSVLIANNTETTDRNSQTYNINYRYNDGKERTLNIDLDYGNYAHDANRHQPNRYYDAGEEVLLTEIINRFETPSDIDIYTFKIDYEDKIWGGRLGIGSKLSRVHSDNTFLFFDEENGTSIRNDRHSNEFTYNENVYAGYISYARALGKKWNFSAGLRAEQTDARGDLRAFLPELQEPPVVLDYLSWFPNAGLSWQVAPQHTLALNYGRRINRPDYNVLNPFNNQLSQLSYEKGNPFLQPEIVNNLELGYTLAYRYNFKIGYSKTADQITRLIAPDEEDPRANFISWDNLASQTIYSMNISAPAQLKPWWNAYFNLSASHLDNQADYGDGAVVDVQAFTYSVFSQHTFDLPLGFKAEVSGYYSGPGVWGGVFEYESNWSLNLGLQRKFMQEQLHVRLSARDIFYETGWVGTSEFNGLTSSGSGNWDSRRISLSIRYNFGNENVKSRKRKTGIEDEAGRIGGGE